MFTSCGDSKEESKENSVTKSLAEEEITIQTETEKSAESAEKKDYLSAVETYIECTLNADNEGTAEICFPLFYLEASKIIEEVTGESLIDYNDFEDASDFESMTVEEIISETPLDDDIIQYFNKEFGRMKRFMEYVDEIGRENITKEIIDEKMKKWLDIEIVTKAYKVKMKTTAVYKDGKEEEKINNVCVYYVDGEGWKFATSGLYR